MGLKKFLNEARIPEKRRLVALYCRVSTIEQAEEGYSIDEQERLLEEWCKW